MQSITVSNVNQALPLALSLLRDTGERISPRGLATIEMRGPFATTYELPAEMVLFDSQRDANPFFHLFESLWVLYGRSDVQFLSWFLPRMADFSDDGKKFHAPYGYRLRHSFGIDQIEFCVKALSADRSTRQAVMSIWDPTLDWKTTRDRPCNCLVMFKIRDDKLRMTVCNRSNDAVLGAYGANVVQFSTLQKYLAGILGVDIGTYTQLSDSFHVYEDNPFWQEWLSSHTAGVPSIHDPYRSSTSVARSTHGYQDDVRWHHCKYMPPHELSSGAFDDDLKRFFTYWDEHSGPSRHLLNERNYSTDSFIDTLLPMLQTIINWRNGKRIEALETASYVKALDWQMAAKDWMVRRIHRG